MKKILARRANGACHGKTRGGTSENDISLTDSIGRSGKESRCGVGRGRSGGSTGGGGIVSVVQTLGVLGSFGRGTSGSGTGGREGAAAGKLRMSTRVLRARWYILWLRVP